MLFNGPETTCKVLLPMGKQDPHQTHNFLGPNKSDLSLKQHLDQFSRFCTVAQCAQHTDTQTILCVISTATGHTYAQLAALRVTQPKKEKKE